MKSYLSALVVILFSVFSFAASNVNEYRAEFDFNHGSGFQNNALGSKVMRDTVRVLRVQYDFAKQGGAVSTITLPTPVTPGSKGAAKGFLPKSAIVVGCYIDVITAPTSGGSATISVGTGQTGVDLKALTAYASYTGIIACIPVGTAATAIKMTADASPSIAIAVAALTAGKFNVDIEYILSDP